MGIKTTAEKAMATGSKNSVNVSLLGLTKKPPYISYVNGIRKTYAAQKNGFCRSIL